MTQPHERPQSKSLLNIASTTTALTHQAPPTIMAPDADFHSQPDTTHPNLLTLPDELKLQILSNLYNDDNDPSNALTLMILRRTHKSLRQLIPNPWKAARPTAKHYITAERRYPYLFPFRCTCNLSGPCYSDRCPGPYFDLFPCYDCLRVIKWGDPYDIPRNKNFKNYEIAYLREGEGDPWEAHWDDPGSKHAQDRICDECWQRRLGYF